MVKDDGPPWHWSIIQICDFLLALGFTCGITEVFHMKDQNVPLTNNSKKKKTHGMSLFWALVCAGWELVALVV